jgi:hypothetical protein
MIIGHQTLPEEGFGLRQIEVKLKKAGEDASRKRMSLFVIRHGSTIQRFDFAHPSTLFPSV